MRVFLEPHGLHSRAMVRVANALKRYAPTSVEFARYPEDADLVVAHIIGTDSLDYVKALGKSYAMIQYCLATAGGDDAHRADWDAAKLVWSYYDLGTRANFYHAPLGVDDVFTQPFTETRRGGVMTSGYVSSEIGEAIEEVAVAAWMLNVNLVHLGPMHVEGFRNEMPLNSIHGIDDERLAEFYRSMKWVSGLRHIEGFEVPVIEGLCCGARPIVFDRDDMTQWYTGHAIFVPETNGPDLIKHLLDVLGDDPEPVTRDEREWAIDRFNWERIATGFWERAL